MEKKITNEIKDNNKENNELKSKVSTVQLQDDYNDLYSNYNNLVDQNNDLKQQIENLREEKEREKRKRIKNDFLHLINKYNEQERDPIEKIK